MSTPRNRGHQPGGRLAAGLSLAALVATIVPATRRPASKNRELGEPISEHLVKASATGRVEGSEQLVAIFGPKANLWTNTALISAAVLCLGALLSIWVVPLMNYNTQERYVPEQPVPFSHQHHVSGLGLDCRYCHMSVETSQDAGMPPTETCMTCHSQIWTHAGILEPVRTSFAENIPLRWNWIYRLPDYVYFDHSIHIAKGVGCTECHGPIGDMALTRRASTLYMSWCLSCHRDPARHLRPLDQVFNSFWQRTPDTPSGKALMAAYHIHPETLSDCGVCHR